MTAIVGSAASERSARLVPSPVVAGTFPRCFEALDAGRLHLRNRLMMTTHGPRLPQRRYLPYLEARSAEVAMVGIHAAYGMGQFPPGPGRFSPEDHPDPDAVVPHPLSTEGRAWCEQFVPALAEQAAAVHRGGALCAGQLHHAGAADAGDSLGAVAGPSAVVDEYRRRPPHVLTPEEIADLVQVYGEAAGRVRRAGCDVVEVHAGHGYLLQQFLSPLTNRRDDAYGGDLAHRMRLLLEVVEAVLAAVGDDLPVGVRIPGSEAAAGGLTTMDMVEVCRALVPLGVSYLSVSNGTYTGLRGGLGLAYVAPATVPQAPSAADAAQVRAATGLPVVVTGRITDPETAEALLEGGTADVIGFTRALIADPAIFAKARDGRRHEIVGCIACNECHTGLPVRCTVNPVAGRERELAVDPAPSPRRVVVVGAGPAGLQCAAVAAERGHRVTLLEREPEPGGALRRLAGDADRPQLAGWLDSLLARVGRAGVDVRCGREATVDAVKSLRPDEVVVATGADEVLPEGGGPDGPAVLGGLEVLGGEAPLPSGDVVVVGGLEPHVGPLAVAGALARAGARVTLLTELLAEGEGVEPATRFALVRRLASQGVTVRRLSALYGIEGDKLAVRDVLTNRVELLGPVDAVVAASERRARTAVADELRGRLGPGRVHLIGDCWAPRRLLHATTDAARQAVVL